MQISEVSAITNPVADTRDDFRFDKSLQELRDLRTQLHYAADYCENTFLNSKEKKTAVENTKEYICQAVITLVDHLGNVSANLDGCISHTNSFSEAELRINSLKQRLLSCEQYTHKIAFARYRWGFALPRYNRRYLSAPITNVLMSNDDPRDCKFPSTEKIKGHKHELVTEDVPLFMFTNTDKLKSSLVKNPSLRKADAIKKCDPVVQDSALVPVRDGILTLYKDPSHTFHFQVSAEKIRRRSLCMRSLHSSDIISLIRRIKKNSKKD